MSPEWLTRRLWNVLEPIHAVVYFAPEVHDSYGDAGLRGFWMGYFAGRSHPLGPVPAEVVTATFFNFAPAMVARAIPDAWHFSTPDRVAAARRAGIDAALQRLLGPLAADDQMAETAEISAEAVADCDPAGRALYAAHAALDWPTGDHLVVWHAATMFREFRGDGHAVANLAHGIDGLGAHVLAVASGDTTRAILQPNRGWTDPEWTERQHELAKRGLLRDGTLTAQGQALRVDIEDLTDRLAAEPVQRLGPERAQRLIDLATRIASAVVAAGAIPVPNPMGVPWPPP